VKRIVVFAAVCGVLGLVACGDDKGSSEESEKESTPAVALQEIGLTRDGVKQALATYRDGDKATAEEQISETYLQHFEKVEGPLGKVDEKLNEELEESISGELREKFKSGTTAQVEELGAKILADLGKAEAALR